MTITLKCFIITNNKSANVINYVDISADLLYNKPKS